MNAAVSLAADARDAAANMTFESSATLGALFGALAKAQGAMSSARKDSTGKIGKDGGRSYSYASLASVVDAVRAPLSTNELAFLQTTENVGPDAVCVVTTLGHVSGEWVRGRLFMPVRQMVDREGRVLPPDAQGFGSAVTYARRYALSAITGVAPDDDDGAEAVRGTPMATPTPTRTAPVRELRAVPPPSGPRAMAAAPTTGMSEAEAKAVEELTPRFATAKNIDELKIVCSDAIKACGNAAKSQAYKDWYVELKRQSKAALGIPDTEPGPVKAAPAAPAPAKAGRAVLQ